MDTATAQVGVAVGRDGAVLASVALDAGRRHAEELVPAIRRVLAEAGVGLPDLHFVSCGIGPGLFTGLRVGVTTARTLGQVLGLPVVGVPSLDLVARPWTGEGHEVVALIDARRREVFSARYAAGGDGGAPMDGYSVGPPAAVAQELAARGRRTLLVGDGAVVHAASFADLVHVDLIGAEAAAPSLAALVTLATERFRAGDHHTPEELLPLYLRRSDAEIAWEGR